jgi:hypothetical protein
MNWKGSGRNWSCCYSEISFKRLMKATNASVRLAGVRIEIRTEGLPEECRVLPLCQPAQFLDVYLHTEKGECQMLLTAIFLGRGPQRRGACCCSLHHDIVCLPLPHFKTLKSTVVIMCTTYFSIHNLCVLPTQCICVFRVVLTINSDYFPKQH